MLIWRRAGILVPIIAFAGLVIIQALVDGIFGAATYQNNDWPKIVAVLFSGAAIGGVGFYLNYVKRPVLIDEEGQQFKEASHTFFFIPMEYWAAIVPAFFIYVFYFS